MSFTLHRRLLVPIAAAGIVGIALAGCTGDIAAEDAADVDCGPYEDYGTFDGEEVTISGTIVEEEADRLINSWSDFATCTGIDIKYQGTRDFEATIAQLAEGGNAPDIGIVPQPGLVALLAENGYLEPASAEVEANVDEFWSPDWKQYSTIDDVFYGAPMLASVKGYIWYSPSEFEENGWEIPTTLDELSTLTETIAADSGHLPWCAGMESGEATGWPGTDWIEDYVLRLHGPEVYDQWVTHQIPFNDPRIVEAFDAAGEFLKNPEYIDTESLISTPFQEGGLAILDGQCSLHHQASFYEVNWGDGVEVGPDGDVFAFIMPPVEAGGDLQVTGGGETVVAFRMNDAIDAVQQHMSSDVFAQLRVAEGGTVSANNAVDPSTASSPLLEQTIEILQDEATTFRYDGSDLMPGAVGSNSFWKGIVGWLSGDDTKATVDAIENSWPAS
ncbi:alpha-glucoside transport system substrate-binding protein [Diaminobutyricimonas aerilata]|uniref:Alpha-glucoside transport system substrate-binding protein n=1 Tax=Diaminobutyricimonas aerilata TaxID=1162967 RepID=A0A2M9CGF1_9MICO|nr:ABC transporter substrate-binding protein [Diaminobutyricimonas aerilata]PJJ71004.1 alpha-glucoside transport system substrate-binding protein [Diaminobutyricimonas aerilata]